MLSMTSAKDKAESRILEELKYYRDLNLRHRYANRIMDHKEFSRLCDYASGRHESILDYLNSTLFIRPTDKELSEGYEALERLKFSGDIFVLEQDAAFQQTVQCAHANNNHPSVSNESDNTVAVEESSIQEETVVEPEVRGPLTLSIHEPAAQNVAIDHAYIRLTPFPAGESIIKFLFSVNEIIKKTSFIWRYKISKLGSFKACESSQFGRFRIWFIFHSFEMTR